MHFNINMISRSVPAAFYRVRTLERVMGIFVVTRPDMDYSKRRGCVRTGPSMRAL